MAGSLQDQLLSKGLVNKKKAKQVQREKGRAQKLKNKNGIQIKDENKQEAQKAKELKIEQDRKLNLELKAKADKVAIKAQIKQLIEVNQILGESKDVAFIFQHKGKAQTLVVSRQQQEQLQKGRLSIVTTGTKYQIVANQVADRIAQRDMEYIAYQADLQALESDEEDPYADYEIPDDLMW